MGTEVAIYDRITDPIKAVEVMGMDIAKSGLFGEISASQGKVFAMECMARRMPPLMLAQKYHVIFNRLSMKADAMLAGLHALGGSHRIVKRTSEEASVEVTHNGGNYTFSLTWEEAKQEPFIYEGKEGAVLKMLADPKLATKLEIKAKYRTPRARMQMLWARVVSDGVGAVCPEVKDGTYTPEEIEDFSEGEGKRRAASRADQTVAEQNAAAAADAAGDVIDAEYEVHPAAESAAQQPTPASRPAAQPVAEPANGAPQVASGSAGAGVVYATGAQVSRITALYEELQIPYEVQQKALASRNVNALRSLTIGQAGEILTKLESRKVTHDAAAAASATIDQVAGEASVVNQNVTSRPVDGPCTPDQVAKAKALLVEMSQLDPLITGKVKAHLMKHGKKVLADLTERDCDLLISRLAAKNMDLFFGQMLGEAAAKGGQNANGSSTSNSTGAPLYGVDDAGVGAAMASSPAPAGSPN